MFRNFTYCELFVKLFSDEDENEGDPSGAVTDPPQLSGLPAALIHYVPLPPPYAVHCCRSR